MKKLEVLMALTELFDDVKAHPEVGKEIKVLILGSGHEKEFIRLFKKQLSFAKSLGYKVIELEQFEKLTDSPGLYSMHIESKNFNVRIIYSYYRNGELLLHCFHEEQGKSITEYRAHIPVAVKRKKEMEGQL